MAHSASPALVRHLGSLFDGDPAAGRSDRQLLERFVVRRDAAGEDAFAILVDRHGPMVLNVCRQLLGDRQHAEDAFQAVFLVLARKARSLREPDLLGPWLYGVALRTARKERGRLARRQRTEAAGAVRAATADRAEACDRAMLDRERDEALHGEIGRLPGSFRAAIVLCYFERLTLDEAAHRLRWPAGTLRSRLARAREKLRRGLLRRGVVLSAAALAAALECRNASAAVSPLLGAGTTRAATAFAARQAAAGTLSATAASLAREVLRSMLIPKLRLAALSALLLAAAAAGAGPLGRALALGIDDAPEDPPASRGPAPGRMLVVGRVLDPRGKQVPGARVMVYGSIKQGKGGESIWEGTAPAAIGQEESDGSGTFRIDAPRISSATHHDVGATAIAPGYGVGWADLDLDADRPTADITLRPEQVIHGRLFDVMGRPAEGVRVTVEGMGHLSRSTEQLPDTLEGGPVFWDRKQADGLPAWPRPAVTDAEGRFTLRGIGRDLSVLLGTDDPRFARQRIVVATDSPSGTKAFTGVVEPAKVIIGRVTYADTGKPVARAMLSITAHRRGGGYGGEFATDAEGRFRANPLSADRYSVSAIAPAGQPYLNVGTGIFDWPKGALEHRVDLALTRGTVIRGKVVEKGSGRPVAGALLGFVPRSIMGGGPGSWSGRGRTGPDGAYQFTVLPESGTLFVLGASEHYVLEETGERGGTSGSRWYAHAIVACDLNPGEATREVDVALRRGTTVHARVVGPDGQPVKEAWILSRILPLPQPASWRSWSGEFHGYVRDGRCALHGLPDDAEVPVFFLDPKRELGATVRLSGKSANPPRTVRLEPCGTARARFVDAEGKPLAGYRDPYIASMVVTPGPYRSSRDPADRARLAADQDFLARVDPIHYPNGLASDDRGVVTFPALIPGATYRVFDNSGPDGPAGRRLLKEFVPRAGEDLDLGDLVIANPQDE